MRSYRQWRAAGARRRVGPRRAAAAACALAVTIGFAGCGQDAVTRSIGVSVVGGAAGFDPETITVDKGDRVVMTVSNPTEREHGFTVSGLRVRETLAARGSATVTLSAGRGGTFKIWCHLHEAHQIATLVVR